ncbi:DUF6597 domain-containing transcriptional factor [Galbibacter pacificus]|uniref:AraC family transcriptional regulator n=1 Tax=Galbibacter pacificus TaxID=2996052 RepID=A0ABT6FST5_9FLAO|nr:DUF6597 domain-containing transcriptional factor [Galbibacter pacificus]MDG3582548.1 AraC family transcriptional regulator [Galbibacter pacificus]MDG3586333.1 AraC family transcriptional regulator [Galbibacter pacificus]
MSHKDETYKNFRIAVPTAYENVFSHFYFAENQSNETITKTVLPSYQTILIFNFGTKALLNSKHNTRIEIDKCLVLGTIRKAFDYSLPPQSKILVANFKNDAFYRFFGNTSLAENLPMNPDELLNENCFTALWHELSKIDDENQQVNYILKFCRPYLQPHDKIAEKLTNFKEQSLNPIKAIAIESNQTERNIQIKQKKHFGYSAKEINRYQRFLKAIEYIENIASKPSKEDWFAIINHCDYYDQSQLIKDFKYYLNLSPTKYLKFQKDICNPVN